MTEHYELVNIPCEICNKPFYNLKSMVNHKRWHNQLFREKYHLKHCKRKQNICKTCNQIFYPLTHNKGLYCSRRCYHNRIRNLIKKECAICKTIFYVTPAFDNLKCCSIKCRKENKSISDFCLNCHKPIRRRFSAIKKNIGQFCGMGCSRKYRGETSIEKIVRLKLQDLKVEFIQEKYIGKRYIADFFINPNLIIECDGKYWHNIKRDNKKNEYIFSQGLSLLRLKEQEIHQETELSSKILYFIRGDTNYSKI